MRNVLSQTAVILVVIVNVGLGILGILFSRSLLLGLIASLYRDGRLGDVEEYRISYIMGTVDKVFLVLVAVAALIVVALLHNYYLRGLAKGMFLRRTVRILGLQLLYLGAIQVGIRSGGGDLYGAGLSLLLVVVLLIGGAGLATLSLRRLVRR